MSCPVIIVLEDLRSLYNIGSIFRVADGLGGFEVILVGACGFPPHSGLQKTALGAESTVNWSYFKNSNDCLSYLTAQGYSIVCVEVTASARSVASYKPIDKLALVFGSETDGVSSLFLENSVEHVFVPMQGYKESFNVATAAAMVLYELQRDNLTQ